MADPQLSILNFDSCLVTDLQSFLQENFNSSFFSFDTVTLCPIPIVVEDVISQRSKKLLEYNLVYYIDEIYTRQKLLERGKLSNGANVC